MTFPRFLITLAACCASASTALPNDKPANLVRTAKSGAWSEPATWEGGKIPATGARVQVRSGHAVVYDVKSAEVIRFIHVAGMLSFAPDKDTMLNVGLIKIQAGN